ncbi:MAG: hypothetical protein IJ184_01715 [Alphaproteobacteria bacterium]|nr:hypothetical protein [Alphaproteobacteria bacterium]
MPYFLISLWGIVTLVIIRLFVRHIAGLKRRFAENSLAASLIDYRFFNTGILLNIAKYVCAQPAPLRQKLLQLGAAGRLNQMKTQLKDRNIKRQLALITRGQKGSSAVDASLLERLVALNVRLSCFEHKRLRKLPSELTAIKLPVALRGMQALIRARLALSKADLLEASRQALAAVNWFGKAKWHYERAEAYFLLGKIYRAADYTDHAVMMFDRARKLFKQLGSRCREAEVVGTLGIAFAARDDFDTAEKYFAEAFALAQDVPEAALSGLILCHQIMLYLVSDRPERAKKCHKRLQSCIFNRTPALVWEVYARMACVGQKPHLARRYAAQADDAYHAEGNSDAALEMETLFLELKPYITKYHKSH